MNGDNKCKLEILYTGLCLFVSDDNLAEKSGNKSFSIKMLINHNNDTKIIPSNNSIRNYLFGLKHFEYFG